MDNGGELLALRRERDLWVRMLELRERGASEAAIADLLGMVVDISGAAHGFVELYDGGAPSCWLAHGCSEQEVREMRERVTGSSAAELLSSGRTVHACGGPSECAWVCAPVGKPPLGALYVRGPADGGDFPEPVQRAIELFAYQLGSFASAILPNHRDAAGVGRGARAQLKAEDLIGRSRDFEALLAEVAMVASSDETVLLTGPTGTGKTELARVIHASGTRSAGPFMRVNCSNLCENLFESQMFGACPGAYTNATHEIEGLVAAAEGGTLLLDDVSELTLANQPKLLQFLDTKQYCRLGSTRLVRADVRIVATSNADLAALVAQRLFREDLFYRLDEARIVVPPLSERRGDIALLAEHFCRTACEHRGMRMLTLSLHALRAAESQEWPGNLRQLRHAVTAAVRRAQRDGASVIEPRHLFPEWDSKVPRSESLREALRACRRDHVRDALSKSAGNMSEAAKRLGISRSRIYVLAGEFDVTPPRVA